MPVTPEEEFDYWDAKATELRRTQLESVRATATKWTALMGALLGVFGTVAFAGGLQTVDKLSDPWALIVKGLTSAAAAFAVCAIALLSLAAGGLRISKEPGLTATSVRRMFTEDTHQALRYLNWGRMAALVAAAIVLAGSTLILWVGPQPKPPPTALSITASSAAMTYGGTLPAITPSYSGFVGNDTPASLSAPPSCSTTATPASPAGTYPSACTGAADPNYTIRYVPGTVTVDKATTTTTLTAHRNPSARRPPITLTATVTAIASAQTPAGDVDFYAGNPAHHHRLLGAAPLTTSGTAVFTATTLNCGHQQLYAVYLGSTNDLGSTSARDPRTAVSPAPKTASL